MRRMSEFFYAHELEVMKSKALEYELAIAEGNWAALDLAPSYPLNPYPQPSRM